jgi:transglycosylase-like protein with SLT domain
MNLSTDIRLILLCLALVISSDHAFSQAKQQSTDKPAETQQQPEQVRLKLTNGSYLTVDDAWETPQGFWYRLGGITNFVTRDRVKAIDRSSNTSDEAVAPTAKESKRKRTSKRESWREEVLMHEFTVPTEQPATAKQTGEFEKPAWIYLKGGARVEADTASESPAGVWYTRGPISTFIDRSRIDRIELEDAVASADPKKERGWSTGNRKLDSLIRQNGYRYRVDPYLIFLVIEQESHFNSRVVSPKGAQGLMQLMPGTAARFGVRRPYDPAQNVSGGTRYLRELLNRFNNRVDLVLASYNAGEGAVMKFGRKVPPYEETRNYVKRISYKYRRNGTSSKPAANARGSSSTAGR